MPGPQRQFDEATVLRKAMRLFWEHGYEGVSIGRLTEATGLNRSSMYNAFGGKAELYYATLRLFAGERLAVFEEAAQGDDSPVHRLTRGLAALERHSARHGRRGCFCCNAASELGPTDPESAAITNEFFEGFTLRVQRLLREGIERGELAPTTDTERLAGFMLIVVAGVAVLGRAGFPARGLSSLPALIRSDIWRAS